MAEHPSEPLDPGRIDIERESDCRYWSRKFGVTPEALKRAVSQVGDKPEDVERFLAQGPGNTDPSGASHWRATSGL